MKTKAFVTTTFIILSLIGRSNPTQLAHAATGPRCYVNDNAAGANNGNDWTNAYTSLQSALADANCTEIWVAAGVYKPTTVSTNRSASFALKSGVQVYGGFAGTETTLSQRDWAANKTILSGDIDNNDLTDPGGVVTTTAHIIGNNSYHVVVATNVDSSAVLDGFIITAGRADG